MDWIKELPQWIQDLMFWVVNGGGVALLTWLFTQLRIKSRAKQIKLEAKEEQIEALLQSQIDLRSIVYNLGEIILLNASGSKALNPEEREKLMAVMTVMRKKHNMKIDQSVIDMVEEAKIRIAERKKKEIEKVEERKSEAEDKIKKLGATMNEIISKEVAKNTR